MSKIFFSKKTGGFFHSNLAKLIADDVVEVSAKEHSALLLAQAGGSLIVPNEFGRPIAIDPPQPTPRALLDSVKSEMRDMRRGMLDAVTGIGFRATVVGNAELAQEAAQVSQQLLDITDDPALNAAQTYDDMRAAGMAAYRRIADSVSPGLRSAFKELEK